VLYAHIISQSRHSATLARIHTRCCTIALHWLLGSRHRSAEACSMQQLS